MDTPGPQSSGNRRTYPSGHFELLARSYEDHFWHRTRSRLIECTVQQVVHGLPRGYRVLEIGCGTGAVTRRLAQACPNGVVLGMEYYAEGIEVAREVSGCQILRGDIFAPPFAGSIDVVGLFDVIEHIEDHAGALRSVAGILRKGGSLVVTVPAHRWLWSYWDDAALHCRRYEVSELRQTLEDAGFQVRYISQFMASLVPLVFLKRVLAGRVQSRSRSEDELVRDDLKVNPLVNLTMKALLRPELALVRRRWRLPAGTSILAVAQT